MSMTRLPDPGNEMPPGLEQVAERVRAEFRRGEITSEFRDRLRSEIAGESARLTATTGAQSAVTSKPRWRLPRFPRRLPLLLSGAVVAAALIIALIASLLSRAPQVRPTTVAISASFAGQTSVDPRAPLRIHFSVAVDHASVLSALRVVPAAKLSAQWQGNDLVLIAPDGLAPNTAYTIDIDASRAHDTTGAPLAGPLRLFVGTAAVATSPPAQGSAATLRVESIIAADDGSEAVIARDGSLLATAAHLGSAPPALVRLARAGDQRLGVASSAVCMSQSGRSFAFLEGSGPTARVVIAAGNGTLGRAMSVAVDPGSPLGWIGDDEVSFVGGGVLRAVDRSGNVRILDAQPIDAANDTVDIAPGGRYVFLGPQSNKQPGDGQLIDLRTHASTTLRGVTGDPTFSNGGATVAWLDSSTGVQQLDAAPSAGGVRREAVLPVAASDRVSNLALSPDGSRVLYTLTRMDGRTETRLAWLRDGVTEAVVSGVAASPNWAPNSDRVAVLTQGGGGPEIAVIDTPLSPGQLEGLAAATALTFADAQLSGDQTAMHTLAPGVDASRLPRATRASVLSVTPSTGAVDVVLRMVVDADAAHPVPRATEEMVRLAQTSATSALVVLRADAAPLEDLTSGPHVTSVRIDSPGGQIDVGVDSAIDPGSLAAAVVVAGEDGRRLAASVTYDPGRHALMVMLLAGTPRPATVTVTSSLRDIDRQSLRVPVSVTLG